MVSGRSLQTRVISVESRATHIKLDNVFCLEINIHINNIHYSFNAHSVYWGQGGNLKLRF